MNRVFRGEPAAYDLETTLERVEKSRTRDRADRAFENPRE
jgi:hypothetical protein